MQKIPDPFKNYTMKNSVFSSNSTDQNGITEAELEKLEGMTKEELIALIRRVAGAMWGVCLNTPAETAQAMLDRLAYEALGNSQSRECIAAINAWLDRVEGKPIARQEVKAVVASISAEGDLSLLKRIKSDLIEGKLLLD